MDETTGEDLLLGSEPLRAAFIEQTPAMLVGFRLYRSHGFLDDVGRVACYELSVAALADRYVRHSVMRKIVGLATAAFIEAGRIGAGMRLVNLGGPVAGFVDGKLRPDQRRRWRGLGWKLDAAEVLAARGDRLCLLPGCDTRLAGDGRRSYCSAHQDHERWFSDMAAKRHDRRLEAVHDLLNELQSLEAR